MNERAEVVYGERLASGGNSYLLKELVAHDSCWAVLPGHDINDAGDIVGWGRPCENPGALAPAVAITKRPELYR